MNIEWASVLLNSEDSCEEIENQQLDAHNKKLLAPISFDDPVFRIFH